jgi:Ankyrin repeats (3 copies)/NACHT domain
VLITLICGLDVVKEHLQTVSDHFHKQEIRYQNDQQRKCHVAFKLDNYEQQKDINIDRAAGTCQWVLGDKKYIEWHQSSSDSLLWISADPGCGKSVLSKSLVDQELQDTTTHTVCYFFFKENERQDKLNIALCALLHQLFNNQRQLLRHVTSAYEKNGDKLSQEEGELWRILFAATADPKASNVTCVLDALDECRDDDRWRLIDMLSYFHVNSSSSHRRNNWLKFLVTSRPYDDIQRTFQKRISSLPVIRLRGEDENDQIRKEIDMVVRERVSELAANLSLKPETRTRLERKLLQMEHRTYLWLHLAIDHVYNTYRDSLRPDDESLQSLPSTVEAAYEKILERVSSGVKGRVKAILQIVVGARRPLTISEMALALDIATSSHLQSAIKFSINKDHLEQNIRHWCGLFIFINYSKIYLIYQTAREFLICENGVIRTGWKHCFRRADTETHMTRMCVRFLLLEDLQKNISHRLVTATRWNFNNVIEDKSNRNVIEDFLLYLAEHWPGHLRSSDIGENDSLMTKVYHLYDTTNEWFLLLFRLFWFTTNRYRDPSKMNRLRLASFNGHNKIVRMILVGKDVDVDETDKDGQTALMWASEGGHETVVQMLLNKGAEVNAQGGRYGNALQAASQGGHQTVVQMLLDKGAEVNAQGGHCGNALQAASQGGHQTVV